jgi:ATP-binding cassette, sub-family E, member 1
LYGNISMPFSVREGINVFLKGFNHIENMTFRDEELSFKFDDDTSFRKNQNEIITYKYPKLEKKMGDFQLAIEEGSFNNSQIVVMLGENGTGKTTFMKILAGKDQDIDMEVTQRF